MPNALWGWTRRTRAPSCAEHAERADNDLPGAIALDRTTSEAPPEMVNLRRALAAFEVEAGNLARAEAQLKETVEGCAPRLGVAL